MKIIRATGLLLILLAVCVPGAWAEEGAAEAHAVNLNIVWTCIAAFLVFFMQAGFAMVEAGFTRAKNSINIIMKNLMDFSIGTLAFFLIGFGLMFGKTNGLFGTTDFMLGSSVIADPEHWNWTFLIFQIGRAHV